VGALAVAQDRVDLAGLGVDQERLEQLAVALEQGVGQRAVPPEHPLPVQVDEQAGDGVEQPLAVLDQLAGETPEQPPELPGMLQVLGDQDGVAGVGLVDQPDRPDRRELADLQVAQDPVLLDGDPARELLEGVQDVVGFHEADQVAAGPDVEVAEAGRVLGPLLQRVQPRQGEQSRGGGPQADRDRGGHGGHGSHWTVRVRLTFRYERMSWRVGRSQSEARVGWTVWSTRASSSSWSASGSTCWRSRTANASMVAAAS